MSRKTYTRRHIVYAGVNTLKGVVRVYFMREDGKRGGGGRRRSDKNQVCRQ